ncbi:ferredoxin-type protein NapF [Mesorhizobium sp. ANAO-SY3R2]|uniref:ferredoxin-type protein NapF n=1 Tax=Mesorhizobium sp. ANAO-SY3R2 TaxID=3166644 RepID=UPI00366AD82A
MAPSSLSRRALLLGHLASRQRFRIYPPEASEGGLNSCIGCGACVASCPTGIIVLADGVPEIDLAKGECTFCGECSKGCPEPVFDAVSPVRFAHVAAISDSCLARLGIACGICRDVCPEQAIRMRPRPGGIFVPEIDEDTCSGCGACIGICPATAIGVAAPKMEPAHA